MNLKGNLLVSLCNFLWQHLAAVAISTEKMLIKYWSLQGDCDRRERCEVSGLSKREWI